MSIPGGGAPEVHEPPSGHFEGEDDHSLSNRKSLNRILIPVIAIFLLIVFSSGLYFLERGKASPAAKHGKTPTVDANATASAASGTPAPLFTDNFVDNSRGWAIINGPGYTRTIANNALILTDSNHQILPEPLPTDAIYNDFTVTSTFTLLQADRYDGAGIYVRGDSNLDHDYRIEIFGDDTYSIVEEYLDSSNNPSSIALVQPTRLSLIHPKGQQNKVTVTLKGTALTLLINGTFVKSIAVTDYTKGQIALFVQNGNTSDGAIASFSSVEVDPVTAEMPTS